MTNQHAGVLSFILLLASCAAPALPANPPRVAAPSSPVNAVESRTIWDGVFTAEQARRGERVADSHCALCHTTDIEWRLVLEAWSGRPILDLLDMIRTTMPETYPGGLRGEEYRDIIAYILRLNSAPTGRVELPDSDEELGQIMVTRRAE